MNVLRLASLAQDKRSDLFRTFVGPLSGRALRACDEAARCGRGLQECVAKQLVHWRANGLAGWAEVECEDCGASWQDVWALADMTECSRGEGDNTNH